MISCFYSYTFTRALTIKQATNTSKPFRLVPWYIIQSLVSSEAIKRRFLQRNLENRQNGRNSKPLSNCRRLIFLDPMLWLFMSETERSHRIHWQTDRKPRQCPKHPIQQFSTVYYGPCYHLSQYAPTTLYACKHYRSPLISSEYAFILSFSIIKSSTPLTNCMHNTIWIGLIAPWQADLYQFSWSKTYYVVKSFL